MLQLRSLRLPQNFLFCHVAEGRKISVVITRIFARLCSTFVAAANLMKDQGQSIRDSE
jgi:hypothetical protein